MSQLGNDLHRPQSMIMHFKKKWLQQERSMAAHRDQCTSSSDLRDLPSASICNASFTDAPHGQATPSPFDAHITDHIFHPPTLHPKRSGIALNIPRFAKYDVTAAPLARFCSDSSTLSNSLTGASDLPWLMPHSPEPFKRHVDHAKTRLPAVKSQERLMIDINKPPPSPAHSMESAVEPSTPCSGAARKAYHPSPTYPASALDFSIPASPAPRALLSHWESSSSRGLAALPARKRGLASPGFVAHLSASTSELPSRSSDLPLHLEHLEPKASPLSSLRKPRTSLQPQFPHTPEKPTPPASAQQQRYTTRMLLESLGQRDADESHEEGEGEGEGEGEEEEESLASGEREGRGSGDEQNSKGGSPKACLHCGTTKTPLWRNGPPGPKSLCNACGIRFNKIRTGKRKPTPKEASMLMKYERSNSLNSNSSDVTSCHLEKAAARAHAAAQQQQQQQRRLVALPVAPATAHKSRSKLSHRPSMSQECGNAEARGLKREVGRTDCTESSEDEDDLEGRPLSGVLQPKAKRLCLSPSSLDPALLSPAKMWRPSPPPVAVRSPVAAKKGGAVELNSELDTDPSSDGESCLSEPPHVPSAPASPAADAMEEQQHDWQPQGRVDEDEGTSEGASDVEAGARLLMEIFHSAPAPVRC